MQLPHCHQTVTRPRPTFCNEMAGSFVYTINRKVKFWETARCFYEDRSASTPLPRRLPCAGRRAADELFAAARGVAPARGDGGIAGTAVLQRRVAHRRLRSTTSTPTPATAAAPSSGAAGCSIRASRSDSVQLLRDTLTGEAGHYLVCPLHPWHRGAHLHPLRRRRQRRSWPFPTP